MTIYQSLMEVGRYVHFGLVSYMLFTGFIALVVFRLVKLQKKISIINKIPGPRTLPILGNALEVNVEPVVFIKTLTELCETNEEEGIARFWLVNRPYVLLSRASSAEVILGSNKHITKSKDYTYLHPWLGTGLLTATGSKWHQRRKILTPAFHFKILDDFVEVFSQQSSIFVEKLFEKADGKTAFDLFHFVTLCTLDIILESAMGVSINAQESPESDYVKAVYKIGALVQYRQTRPWIQPGILFKLFGYERKQNEYLKILHGFSLKVIRERSEEYLRKKNDKKEIEQNAEDAAIGKRKRLAFLDLLIDSSNEGQKLSIDDLREEVDTFMFEGHDTTAAAITWSSYLIATHPDIQAQVHQELDDIFGDDRNRPVTMDDLRRMKVLECCIKEALRLFPSVPFLAREIKEEVVIDGYTVPPGTSAMIVTYKLHRDPEQFPDPELFKPERFLPENSTKRHPYAYVPFSAGPRNCIGQKFAIMEEKTVLSSLLRNFKIDCAVTREELRMTGELILRPENGIYVTLTKR